MVCSSNHSWVSLMGIRTKFIFSLIIANSVIAILIYTLSIQSFDKGFLSYRNKVEAQKLNPLIAELADLYKSKQGWNWIRSEHFLWKELVDKHMFGDSHNFSNNRLRRIQPRRAGSTIRNSESYRQQPPGFPRPNSPDNRRQQLIGINPFLLLKNEDGHLIIGRQDGKETTNWIAILVNDKKVGELGYKTRRNLISKLDKYFVQQAKENIAIILIVLMLTAIILAFLLSNNLLKTIDILKNGLQKLVAGNYDTYLSQSSGDELGQLTHDFNLLSTTLKQNLDSRQKWIADIAHELRTPVAILQGELEALIDGVRETSDDSLKSLQQETLRLGILINDLHDLSLSDQGSLSYKMEKLELNQLVGNFISMNLDRIENLEIKVVVKQRESVFIKGDVDRLEQCLNNLLQNTLRYTDKPGTLDVDLEEEGAYVNLIWQDSSPGVPESDLIKVLDRLYRVEKSRNRATGGSGLGLSICNNIIEAHNATITCFVSNLGGLGIKIQFIRL